MRPHCLLGLASVFAALAAPAAESDPALSNIYNPAMSVNGLFLGSATSKRHPSGDEVTTGLAIQEMELQFIANVDPYFAANLVLAIPDGEGLEVEEGTLTPTEQPLGIQLRLGKLKAPFGRENAI